MLGRSNRALAEPLAGAHFREPARLLVVRIFVASFLINGKEAIELDDRSGGAQLEKTACNLGSDVGRGALEFGGFHLARHGAQPDQFVELCLVGVEETPGLAWPQGKV